MIQFMTFFANLFRQIFETEHVDVVMCVNYSWEVNKCDKVSCLLIDSIYDFFC